MMMSIPCLYSLISSIALAFATDMPEARLQQTPLALKNINPVKQCFTEEELQKVIHTKVKSFITTHDNDKAIKYLQRYRESKRLITGIDYVKYSTISRLVDHFITEQKFSHLDVLIDYFPSLSAIVFSNLAADATVESDMLMFSGLIEILHPYKSIIHKCYVKGLETSIFTKDTLVFHRHWKKANKSLTTDEREDLMLACVQANDLYPFRYILMNSTLHPETLGLCLIIAAYLDRPTFANYLLELKGITQDALQIAGNYWADKLKHHLVHHLIKRKLDPVTLTPEIEQSSLFNLCDISCTSFLGHHNDFIAINHNNRDYLFKCIFHVGVEPFYPPVLRIHDVDEMTSYIDLHRLNFVLPYFVKKDALFYEATPKIEYAHDYIHQGFTTIAEVNYPIKAFLELQYIEEIPVLSATPWRLYCPSDASGALRETFKGWNH